MKHMPLVAAGVMSVAACASAAFWGMQWYQTPARAVVAAPTAPSPPPAIEAAAGLFGGAPAAAAAAVQLKGVIADGPDGVAILAADGKPPVAVGVGQEAAPGVTVREIHLTYVMLEEGGTVRRLDLPLSAIAGLEIVAAAAPDDRFDAPGRPSHHAPVGTVARSGGAMPPPLANPNVVPAPGQVPQPFQGLAPDEAARVRASRPSGIGPGAWSPQPHT